MTDDRDAPEPDLGDEARRLMSAVQDWARRSVPAPPSGHPGPECQWCPLCQFASVLRGEHPELAERVTEAGTALVNALKALAETAAAHTPNPANPVRRPRPQPGPGPRVQHIRVEDTGAAPTAGGRDDGLGDLSRDRPDGRPDDLPDGRP